MSTKWQRTRIDIPKSYTPDEREAIARDIVDYIVKRSKDGKGKGGREFKPYSEAYIKSLNFKIAGKSKGDVNLTLSGDMLGALDLLNHSRGSILIGYENGSQENAKADGNIRGTFGKSRPVAPGRNFLELTKDEVRSILEKYPLDDREKSLSRAERIVAARDAALDVLPSVDTEDTE